MKLDLKDKKILYELGEDAKISCSSLAKRVNLSREVTKYRLKKLIDKGYIKWFIAVIDTTKLGYNTYQFYIQLEKTAAKKEKEIIDFLKNDKRVNYLATISGNWDLMCECYARNPQELFEFISEIRSRFYDNVKNIDSTIIINEYLCLNKNIADEKKEKIMYSFIKHDRFLKSESPLDMKEKMILYHLSNNCRMSYISIAKKIGASVDYVRYRIKQMIKEGIILSFKAVYEYTKLGFQQHIILYSLEASSDETSRFINYLKMHPNVIYAIQSIGRWDISVVVNVKGHDQLRAVLIEIRNNFTNIIKEEIPLFMHEELKNYYLPPDYDFRDFTSKEYKNKTLTAIQK